MNKKKKKKAAEKKKQINPTQKSSGEMVTFEEKNFTHQ